VRASSQRVGRGIMAWRATAEAHRARRREARRGVRAGARASAGASGNAFPSGSERGEQMMASALGTRPSGRQGGHRDATWRPGYDAPARVRVLWRRRPCLKFKVPMFGRPKLSNFKMNFETYR
jgi:hypothetical protein